jgi:two-component system, response regulator RegA
MNDTLPEGEMSLLLVDDDRPFLQRLGRAMETRGFEVRMAQSVAEALSR